MRGVDCRGYEPSTGNGGKDVHWLTCQSSNNCIWFNTIINNMMVIIKKKNVMFDVTYMPTREASGGSIFRNSEIRWHSRSYDLRPTDIFFWPSHNFKTRIQSKLMRSKNIIEFFFLGIHREFLVYGEQLEVPIPNTKKVQRVYPILSGTGLFFSLARLLPRSCKGIAYPLSLNLVRGEPVVPRKRIKCTPAVKSTS